MVLNHLKYYKILIIQLQLVIIENVKIHLENLNNELILIIVVKYNYYYYCYCLCGCYQIFLQNQVYQALNLQFLVVVIIYFLNAIQLNIANKINVHYQNYYYYLVNKVEDQQLKIYLDQILYLIQFLLHFHIVQYLIILIIE